MSTLFDLKDSTVKNDHALFSEDFQTPIWCAKYMVELAGKPQGGANKMGEPTPGKGNIVREGEAAGWEVTAPDDFFLLPKQRFDVIVMNPPFSSKFMNLENAPTGNDFKGMRMGYYVLTQCMEMSDTVIALMPWFTISDSDVRLRYLKSFGLISLTALPRKTFEYARIQTCVFHLQKGYTGETAFKVYDLL